MATMVRERERVKRPVRTVLRFVASVLMTSGILLIADAALTLLWQEPVSAFIGSREQSALASQLEEEAAIAGSVEQGALTGEQLEAAAARHAERTATGEAFGRMELPSLDRDYVMVEGTTTETLRKGPGHYPDTALPGEGRTVAVAGHRTTYGAPFRTIDKLEPGDEIVLEMPYARFVYEVERQRIVAPTETSVTRDVGSEQLVLSACHPLYSAAQRLIVFSRLDRVEPL
jgi:sortase A